MRARIAILSGFLLFSVMSATPAHAGPWSAFVAWLSDLDPKSKGLGLEMTLFCPPARGTNDQNADVKFECESSLGRKYLVKASAAVMLGTLNESGGTIFVVPVLGTVETQYKSLFVGAGAGVIHVGGTLVGGVSQLLIQPVRVTYRVPRVDLGIRAEVNVLTKGFPAGTFAVGAPEKGAEVAFGISVTYIK